MKAQTFFHHCRLLLGLAGVKKSILSSHRTDLDHLCLEPFSTNLFKNSETQQLELRKQPFNAFNVPIQQKYYFASLTHSLLLSFVLKRYNRHERNRKAKEKKNASEKKSSCFKHQTSWDVDQCQHNCNFVLFNYSLNSVLKIEWKRRNEQINSHTAN